MMLRMTCVISFYYGNSGAYCRTERISPSPLLSYSDDSPTLSPETLASQLCVSVSPTTGFYTQWFTRQKLGHTDCFGTHGHF